MRLAAPANEKLKIQTKKSKDVSEVDTLQKIDKPMGGVLEENRCFRALLVSDLAEVHTF